MMLLDFGAVSELACGLAAAKYCRQIVNYENFGLTTLPAALNLLLSPYQGGGNPSIDISSYSLVANLQKCE